MINIPGTNDIGLKNKKPQLKSHSVGSIIRKEISSILKYRIFELIKHMKQLVVLLDVTYPKNNPNLMEKKNFNKINLSKSKKIQKRYLNSIINHEKK